MAFSTFLLLSFDQNIPAKCKMTSGGCDMLQAFVLFFTPSFMELERPNSKQNLLLSRRRQLYILKKIMISVTQLCK